MTIKDLIKYKIVSNIYSGLCFKTFTYENHEYNLIKAKTKGVYDSQVTDLMAPSYSYLSFKFDLIKNHLGK